MYYLLKDLFLVGWIVLLVAVLQLLTLAVERCLVWL